MEMGILAKDKWRFSYFQAGNLTKNSNECKFNNLTTKSVKQTNVIIVRMFEFYISNSKETRNVPYDHCC